MKLYKISSYVLGIFLATIAGGCSDSDDWTPGPQDTETGVAAYFNNPSKTSYTFDSAADESSMVIEVSVKRQHTAEAASVPLILTSDVQGFTIPNTVDFAAGESISTFMINCANIPDGQTASVTVSLDPAQTDIYGEGLYEVTYSVIKADWIEISDNVTYYYDNVYPETTGKMYQLDGTDQFKFTDFFGSGLEIKFNASTPTPSVINPLENAVYDTSYPDEWYLYDEENQTYPTWVPGNLSGYKAIEDMYVYGNGYTTINLCSDSTTRYGYINFTLSMSYSDGTSGFAYYSIDFNLKYNPFE